MTMRHLQKRCAVLEERVGVLFAPLEAAERRRREWMEAYMQLAYAFPEERHEQLLALMNSDAWEGSGLNELGALILDRFWQPTPIPLEVADVYLAEPEVQPQAKCKSCNLYLPHQMGFWTNTETKARYQAALWYFERCPCGGAIFDFYGNSRTNSWLPVRVVPPWTFMPEKVMWELDRQRWLAQRGP
jgi:hypothetical protein